MGSLRTARYLSIWSTWIFLGSTRPNQCSHSVCGIPIPSFWSRPDKVRRPPSFYSILPGSMKIGRHKNELAGQKFYTFLLDGQKSVASRGPAHNRKSYYLHRLLHQCHVRPRMGRLALLVRDRSWPRDNGLVAGQCPASRQHFARLKR